MGLECGRALRVSWVILGCHDTRCCRSLKLLVRCCQRGVCVVDMKHEIGRRTMCWLGCQLEKIKFGRHRLVGRGGQNMVDPVRLFCVLRVMI